MDRYPLLLAVSIFVICALALVPSPAIATEKERIGLRDALSAELVKNDKGGTNLPIRAIGFDPQYQAKADAILQRYAAVRGGWKVIKWGMSPDDVDTVLRASYFLPTGQSLGSFETTEQVNLYLRIGGSRKPRYVSGPLGIDKLIAIVVGIDFKGYMIPWDAPALPFQRSVCPLFYRDRLIAVKLIFWTDLDANALGIAENFKEHYGGKTFDKVELFHMIWEVDKPGLQILGHLMPNATYITFLDPAAIDTMVKEARSAQAEKERKSKKSSGH